MKTLLMLGKRDVWPGKVQPSLSEAAAAAPDHQVSLSRVSR